MSRSSAHSLAPDAAIREQALDTSRSFIVQAPAGSGKTELLTQRFLRLLATVDHPEQVLAITFTRKAAAEMRMRILDALASAANDAPPPAAHARKTWQLARAVRDRDAQCGWQLSMNPARLRIQTIDALTAMLARRLPILSGTGAALEPSDDADALYEAAGIRLLEHLGEEGTRVSALETLILHLGNRLDRLLELLIELLKRRDQWLHPLMHARASRDPRATFEGMLRQVVERHLQQLCTSLSSATRTEMWELTRFAAEHLLANQALDASRRALLQSCLETSAALGPASVCFEAWQAVADVFLKDDGDFYINVNRRHGFPPTHKPVKQRMELLLRELAQDAALCEQLRVVRTLPSLRYSEEQWRVLEALFEILPLAVAELALEFQRQGRADYIENALRALQALGSSEEPTDLALALDYRLHHILVDEFQDTSFVQLELLERLTAGWTAEDGRTLFCVGDPMQSIYRFRHAEVGLFLQLQQHGLRSLPLRTLKLHANFRSTQPIVQWINRVFPQVFPVREDMEQGAVSYSASTAATSSTAGGVRVHPLLDVSPAAHAKTVVDIVRQALARDPKSSVAILVSGRNHLGLIGDYLERSGIDHQAVEIEPLQSRPVVQDLIALTRALVHLADRTAWLAVLRAPWCGLTLADLHALAARAPDKTIRELLRDVLTHEPAREVALSVDGRARLRRLMRVLDRALAQRSRERLRDWVERTWNALGGPATLRRAQDLDDAEAYLQRLDELDRCADLPDVTRLEEYLQGLCASPKTRGHARVEIMTIHKAKGLEFDTVILPSLERGVRGNDQPLLQWTRIPGVSDGLVLAALTATGADRDPIYRWIELLERARTERERARLLYVAATRAKKHLHLVGQVRIVQKPEGPQLKAPRRGSMLALLWPEVAPHFEAALQTRGGQMSLTMDPAATVPLRRLPLGWVPPPADTDVPVANIPVEVTSERPEFDWATQTSRHVGTLVHRELERLVKHGTLLRAPQALDDARARALAELAELGVPADRCQAAWLRVRAAVEATLTHPRGRWILGLEEPQRDAESELALSGVVEGKVINGIIDRTFVDTHGTRWIVDFKTSTHEGAALEEFLLREAERYRPQLARYAILMRAFRPEPVKAALYFPLLRQWREVNLDEG